MKKKDLSFIEILVIFISWWLVFWFGYSMGGEATMNKLLNSMEQSRQTSALETQTLEDLTTRHRDQFTQSLYVRFI